MRYYSDKLCKLFDDETKLFEAERVYDKEQADKAAREQIRSDKWEEIKQCRDKYLRLMSEFREKYPDDPRAHSLLYSFLYEL